MPGSSDACRCSCDPESDGGEYRALIEFKEQKLRERQEEEQEEEYYEDDENVSVEKRNKISH